MPLAPWWERHPGALDAELRAFADLGLSFDIDEVERARGRIVLRGRLPAGRLGEVELAVVYPGTFPNLRPAIYQVAGERLDRHQNPLTGNYCLIGRSSDHWQPSMKAAELVAELPELVDLVDEGGEALLEAEDPQGEPETTYYNYTPAGCVIVPEDTLHLPPEATSGAFKVRMRGSSSTWLEAPLTDGEISGRPGQALLLEVKDRHGNIVARAGQELARHFQGETWHGRWVRPETFIAASEPPELIRSLAELDERLLKPGRQPADGHLLGLHGAVFEEEIRQGERGLSWVFLATGVSAGDSRPASIEGGRVLLMRGQRYSPEVLTERIPELADMPERVIAMVGLGALGAPLAMLLGQVQTGRLELIDKDTVDAATGVRWVGGLSAAGGVKAHYVAALAQADHPFVEVKPTWLTVGGAPLDVPETSSNVELSDDRQLFERFQRSDLVVDATAEDNVSRAVSELATLAQVPQVYLWGVDGYGGVVVRVEPGRTGCFHCFSLGQEDGSIPTAPAAEDEDRVRVQPRGCDDPTFTAAPTELLPLTNQAARVVFSTLCAGTDGYPPIDGDVFVLALREPDGSALAVPRWQSSQLPVHPDCPLCSD